MKYIAKSLYCTSSSAAYSGMPAVAALAGGPEVRNLGPG